MGKKAKVGKARKDRFYHLAKETGYRSRAAFKLIQLNRKYEFLQRSNVIIDLCAAPGGWLQVAAENAPMSNHIIGIDLVPIPPIKGVVTFQEDITTDKCRQVLKKQLHTAKADCFLNDGAPNLGKSWIHDAYLQAELTLHAMKLATEFLRKGGWFVTKLFRSKDYDALLWVFQQLFKTVQATKPQASRNESAEIFVVCQGYLAPDRIDPKFLNPKHVFQEVDTVQPISIDLIRPEKKKRQREGYPDGDYTLFHSLAASEFLASDNFMDLLAQASEVVLDTEEIEQHPLTTAELRACVKDIKVLGKKEIKSILTWRKKLNKVLNPEHEAETEDGVAEDNGEGEKDEGEEEEKDMQDLEKMLKEKELEELKAMKRAKKKVNKAQAKQKARIDLKMSIPGDQIDIQDDENIFDITKIQSRMQLSEVEKGDLTHLDTEDIFEDSDDDGLPKRKERKYFDREEKEYAGDWNLSDGEEEEMEEEPTFEDQDEDGPEDNDDEEEKENKTDASNPLIVDMGVKDSLMRSKQAAWFAKPSLADLDDDVDEDVDLEQMSRDTATSTSRPKAKRQKTENEVVKTPPSSEDEEEEESDVDSDAISEDSEEDADSDYNLTEMLSSNKKKKRKSADSRSIKKVDGIEVVPATASAVPDLDFALDEEGLAIGSAMIQSRKRRREITESAYHRYMFDDDHLPDWFVKDEKKHVRRQTPVTRAEIDEYKLKQKAVDAQPIKKIAEAKARKKRKMMKRQEKARKKANAVTDSVDVSEKEKWQQIKQIYKKAGLLNKKKTSVTYVVAKKGAGKKVRRPAGVKGQFKVVDGRMKKDIKGQKRAEVKSKSKKGPAKATKRHHHSRR